MDDSHQIDVPPSFTQLFTSPGGLRLTEPVAFVRERYELCEDMAQMLTEQASNTLHRLGITEEDPMNTGTSVYELRRSSWDMRDGDERWRLWMLHVDDLRAHERIRR